MRKHQIPPAMFDNVIPFNAQERLLGKVNHYMSALDQLISDGDEAIDSLLAAFAVADEDAKIKIVILLGTLANAKVVPPLLTFMQDSNQGESVRQAAAIQISVVAARIDGQEDLADRLLEILNSAVPLERVNAALALGWEGNLRAAPHLINCLTDTEIEVQQAAVNALSNLQEDKIFTVLAERLPKSAKEQQRAILYNLGHFPSRFKQIARICKTFVHHKDADLRYDALVVLNSVIEPEKDLALHAHCLQDEDARIRELTLSHLETLPPQNLITIEGAVRACLDDDCADVCQAAIRVLYQMRAARVVPSPDA